MRRILFKDVAPKQSSQAIKRKIIAEPIKVYEIDSAKEDSRVKMNKKGQTVHNDFSSLLEVKSFDFFIKLFDFAAKQKSKAAVQKKLRDLVEQLKVYADEYLDEIGYSTNARVVRNKIIKSINKLIIDLDSIKPKEYFCHLLSPFTNPRHFPQ